MTQNPMTQEEFNFVLAHVSDLGRDWPGEAWRWEYRFAMVLSTITKDQTHDAQQALLRAMPELYDHVRINEAPTALRVAVNSKGGVRSGQLVFAAPSDNGTMSYALWWPWGDEETVSVRVGIIDDDGSALFGK